MCKYNFNTEKEATDYLQGLGLVEETDCRNWSGWSDQHSGYCINNIPLYRADEFCQWEDRPDCAGYLVVETTLEDGELTYSYSVEL